MRKEGKLQTAWHNFIGKKGRQTPEQTGMHLSEEDGPHSKDKGSRRNGYLRNARWSYRKWRLLQSSSETSRWMSKIVQRKCWTLLHINETLGKQPMRSWRKNTKGEQTIDKRRRGEDSMDLPIRTQQEGFHERIIKRTKQEKSQQQQQPKLDRNGQRPFSLSQT